MRSLACQNSLIPTCIDQNPCAHLLGHLGRDARAPARAAAAACLARSAGDSGSVMGGLRLVRALTGRAARAKTRRADVPGGAGDLQAGITFPAKEGFPHLYQLAPQAWHIAMPSGESGIHPHSHLPFS